MTTNYGGHTLPAMANAKTEQRAQSHEGILSSARRLLRMKGIAGARVAEVMKGAGLTVGGFYAHFDSKEALVDEALRLLGDTSRDYLFARLDEKPADDRAEVVIKRYLSVAHRDELEQGCPLPATVGEIGTTAPEHKEVLAAAVDLLTSRLEAQLTVKPISPRHLALGLVAMMVGGLSLARALKGTAMSDEVIKACRAMGALVTRKTNA